MIIAEASMIKFKSFENLTQVNVTSEMKINKMEYQVTKILKRELKLKNYSNNKDVLYAGLLLPNGHCYLVNRIPHIKPIDI
jgi:hypothetical protein